MNAKHRNLVVLLGIPFDNLDMDETVARVEAFVSEGGPHYVATANVNFVVKAMHDDEFQEVVRLADIITADGMPLVWASRLLAYPLKERVTGADLVPRLVSLAAQHGWGVFFLGGEPEVAAQAVQRLKSDHPALRVDFYSPEFKPLLEMSNAGILTAIRSFAPQLLFVSLGAGKAEKWIRMNLKDLQVPVCIGVGATIDFLAGKVRRAPKWMQRVGIEWLWRIIQEPGRLLQRYLYDLPVFAGALFRQWRLERVSRSQTGTGEGSEVPPDDGRVDTLAPRGRLDASTVSSVVESGSAVLAQKRSLVVDLAAVDFMDSTGLGGLVALEKQARDQGVRLALAAPKPQLASMFKLARLESFFRILPDRDQASAEVRSDFPTQPLTAEQVGKNLVLSLKDRLDAANAQEMRDALLRLSEQEKAWTTLVLDMSGLTFMDSSGLNMLIMLNKQLNQSGRELVLSRLAGVALQVVRMARLESYFKTGSHR